MADWILVIVRLSWIFSSMDSDKMGCCRSSATTLLSDVHISDDLGVLLMLGDGTDLKTFFWKIEMAFFLSEYWIASICSLLCIQHFLKWQPNNQAWASLVTLDRVVLVVLTLLYCKAMMYHLPYFILTGANQTSPTCHGTVLFFARPRKSRHILGAP